MILTKDSRTFLVLAVKYDRGYYPTVLTLQIVPVSGATGYISRRVQVLEATEDLRTCKRKLRDYARTRIESGHEQVTVDLCRKALGQGEPCPYYAMTPLGSEDAAVVKRETDTKKMAAVLHQKKRMADEKRKAIEAEVQLMEAEKKRAAEHAEKVARMAAQDVEKPALGGGGVEGSLYAMPARVARKLPKTVEPEPAPPRGLEDVRPHVDPDEDATTTRARYLELD